MSEIGRGSMSWYRNELRLKIKELTQEQARRKEAEKALGFYGNVKNWFLSRFIRMTRIDAPNKDDCEEIGKLFVGGKRAREHFKKYEGERDD